MWWAGLTAGLLLVAACGGGRDVPSSTDPTQTAPSRSPAASPAQLASTGRDSSASVDGLPDFVPTALLIAGAMVEAGDYEGALQHYGYALSQDPSDQELGRRFVGLALRMGRIGDALAGVERMRQEHPDDRDLLYQHAHLLLLAGQAKRAEPLTAELLEREPRNPDTVQLRVQVLEALGQMAKAAELQDRLIEAHPDDPSFALTKAAMLLRSGQSEKAEAALRGALERDPALEDAAQILVEHLESQERDDEALALLEELVERTPGSPAHRLALADLYISAGREEEAAMLLLPLAQTGDLDWHSQILLTDLLVRIERIDEAWQLSQGLLEGPETDPLVLQMVGEIALDKGELRRADELLSRAREKSPGNPDILVSLLLARSRRFPELIGETPEPDADERELEDDTRAQFQELLEAAVAAAGVEDFRQNLVIGALLRRVGRTEQAVAHLQRAADLRADSAQVLYDLAWAQEEVGDFRGACDTLERLLVLRPDEAHILNFYGYLLAEQGWELERAEGMIRRALEAEPENGFYLDSMGWVLFQRGLYAEALDFLVDASNLLGDDPTILEHLGDALVELGRFDQAVPVFERALEIGGKSDRLQPRLRRARDEASREPR